MDERTNGKDALMGEFSKWKFYSCATLLDKDMHAYFMMEAENWSPTGGLAKIWLIHDTDSNQNQAILDASVDRHAHAYSIYTRRQGWTFPRAGTKEITLKEFLTATTGAVWQ